MWINIWCHEIIFYSEIIISNTLGCKTGMAYMSCREPHKKQISCLILRRTWMAHMWYREPHIKNLGLKIRLYSNSNWMISRLCKGCLILWRIKHTSPKRHFNKQFKGMSTNGVYEKHNLIGSPVSSNSLKLARHLNH